MIISPWLIYFADLADDIGSYFSVLVTICCLITIGCLITNAARYVEADGWDEEVKFKWYVIKPCSIIAIILLTILTFIPSTNTIYKMMIIPPIINSSITQKLPDELQQFIDKELKVDEVKK